MASQNIVDSDDGISSLSKRYHRVVIHRAVHAEVWPPVGWKPDNFDEIEELRRRAFPNDWPIILDDGELPELEDIPAKK